MNFQIVYRIEGRIADIQGKGVPGVLVSNQKYSTKTDDYGIFSIAGISGKLEIEYSKEGYSFEPSQSSTDFRNRLVEVTATSIRPKSQIEVVDSWEAERLTYDGLALLRFDVKRSVKRSERFGDKLVVTAEIAGVSGVILMNEDGSNQVMIAEGRDPLWNPAGVSIALMLKAGENHHLAVFKIDGTIRQIATEGHDEQFGFWSPDGRVISFISDTGGSYQLYAADSEGKNLKQITMGSAEPYYPYWGDDGWLYFLTNSGYFQESNPLLWEKADLWRIRPR